MILYYTFFKVRITLNTVAWFYSKLPLNTNAQINFHNVVKKKQTAYSFKYIRFNVLKRTQYLFKKIINHVVILALINKMIKDSSLKAIVSDARHIQSNGTLP